MAAPAVLNPQGSTLGPQNGPSGASVSYPTLVPSAPVGGGVGLPQAASVVPWNNRPSDVGVQGAFKVNPAYAGDFFAGRYKVNDVRPGGQEPLEIKNKVVTQELATGNSPNAWKSKPFATMANAILFGFNAPQKPVKYPWNKKFIAPLALFNDAAQWVNRLMFNQPMTPWDSAVSGDIALRAQYYSPPPINSNNLAGGTLNLQLQLGQLKIQAQQLTISASNYFGG